MCAHSISIQALSIHAVFQEPHQSRSFSITFDQSVICQQLPS